MYMSHEYVHNVVHNSAHLGKKRIRIEVHFSYLINKKMKTATFQRQYDKLLASWFCFDRQHARVPDAAITTHCRTTAKCHI